ncbi:kinase-like protein, partial [Obba rivulosa]
MESPQRALLVEGVSVLQRSSGKVAPKDIPPWVIATLDIDFDEKDKLGGGGFAEVFKGQWRGSSVAVKRLRNATGVDDLKREAEIWYRLRHDHIVPFYGASMSSQPPFMVSRYMRNGHLLKYLYSHNDANRVRLLYEVSLGMRYLHDEGIVHGDLKGVNVLIDESNHALITDFGLSSVYRPSAQNEASKPAVGTLRFMAPEAIATGELSYATDVYAYAMLIYETFTGEAPFLAESDADVATRRVTLQRPSSQVVLSRGFTDEMWTLLVECSSVNPDERPNFAKITSKTASLANSWRAGADSNIVGKSTFDSRPSLLPETTTSRTLVNAPGPYLSRGPVVQPSPSRDMTPFRIELTVIRQGATMQLDKSACPVVLSYGIEYACHPGKNTLTFAGDNFFYVSVEHDTDKEKWECSGSKITRIGPGVDVALEFERADHARQWFHSLLLFARGKDLKPKPKGLFHAAIECPFVPVRWQLGGTGWRRVLGGIISCAPWEEFQRGQVPPENMWIPLPMPLSCIVMPALATPNAFSFLAEYEEENPRFWTVTLDGDLVRKEGRRSQRTDVVFIQEERCATVDHARTWFNTVRTVITEHESAAGMSMSMGS